MKTSTRSTGWLWSFCALALTASCSGESGYEICTAGTVRCQANDVQRCSSDGTSWELDQTCESGTACVDGSCIPMLNCGDGTCQPSENENCFSCTDDCGCPPGEVCNNEVCEPEGAVCGDATCDPGENCSSCPGDCACQNGLVCENGSCVTASGLGTPCQRNSDCDSGVCLPVGAGQNVCTIRCSGGLDCVPGWTCGPIGGVEGDVCQCTTTTEVCDGVDNDCDGYVDDGTGAELGCSVYEVCQEGSCQCHPDCAGKRCGDADGCGGTCGGCSGATDYCAAGGQCTDDCAGRECGTSPNEGFDCGTCSVGYFCCSGSCEAGAVCWVSIPGGSFMMGSNSGDADEVPVHQVDVPAFEMTETEVTVSQYHACVDDGACSDPDTGTYCNWGVDGRDDHSVNCIDWQQAVDFCGSVGGRLPSEAEWEYAARGGGQDIIYPWGNESPSCTYAVMNDAAAGGRGCGEDRTWAVCSKTAGNTAQGLCDMAGNVWEWVQDWYHSDYNGAPADGSAWESPFGFYRRVLRGGSWSNGPSPVRASSRDGCTPDDWYYLIGFRCAGPAAR